MPRPCSRRNQFRRRRPKQRGSNAGKLGMGRLRRLRNGGSRPHRRSDPFHGRYRPKPSLARLSPRRRAAKYREILETTVHSESFVADDIRPAPKEPRRIAEYAIPEPVRTWLRPAPERPAPIPARAQSPAPASQPAPRRNLPPAIDVSIGKIEVTIESEPQPPLRAVRRAEPRAAAPPRPAPAAGLLARQYLDR